MNKLFKTIAGVTLIILGIIGLVLPFLQGIALIVTGLVFLDVPFARKIKDDIKRYWTKK